MDKIGNYDISLSSLKLGDNNFDLVVNQSFFDLFDFIQEFKEPKIEVNFCVTKHSSFLEVNMNVEGIVILKCDISDEDFEQDIKNSIKMLVKFGEEFNDENEEILVLPHGAHSLNVAQLIYEGALLSIPMKHIHPRYSSGYQDKYTELLEKYGISDDFQNKE